MKNYYILWMMLLSTFMFGNKAPVPKKINPYKTALNYCIPTIQDPEAMTLVNFGAINNRTAPFSTAGYEDFTAMSTDVGLYRTYEIRLQGNTLGNYYESFTVFIDFDQNGVLGRVDVFDTEGIKERFEVGFIENSTGLDGKVLVGKITIPGTAKLGKTRMRIMKRQTTKVPIKYAETGCDLGNTYGQIEDYTVNIVNPVGCNAAPNGSNLSTYFIPKKNVLGEQLITSTAKTGAYTEILVSEGVEYTLKTTRPNTFSTLKNQLGLTVITSVDDQFTWTSNFTGILRWYTHADELTCSADSSIYSQYVTMVANINPIVDNCSVGIPGQKGFSLVNIGGTNSQQLAFDIPMYQGKKSSVTGININLANGATFINFEELSDANGLPGATISTIKGTIKSKTLQYTQNGKQVYTYEVTFDKPIALDGNLGARKWLKINSDAAYAEMNVVYGIGKNLAIQNNTNTGWQVSDNYEAVYTTVSVCSQDVCNQVVVSSDSPNDNQYTATTAAAQIYHTYGSAFDIMVESNKNLIVKGIEFEPYKMVDIAQMQKDNVVELNLYSNDPATNSPKTKLISKIPATISRELLELMPLDNGTPNAIGRFKATALFDTPLVLDGTSSTRYWLEIDSDYNGLYAEDNRAAFIGQPAYLNYAGLAWFDSGSEVVYKLLTDCSNLSTQETAKEKTKIYPIPFSSSVTISSPTNLKQIEIYSISGTKVLQKNINQNKVELNVNNLPVGVYIIRTVDVNGTIESHKAIKK